MSVCNFPRFYFNGHMRCSPATINNNEKGELFDVATIALRGDDDELAAVVADARGWNPYGTNECEFDLRVTGAHTDSRSYLDVHADSVAHDPMLGARLVFTGAVIVDINPRGREPQIFFRHLKLIGATGQDLLEGRATTGIKSRWLSTSRNINPGDQLGPLAVAGNVWQGGIAREDLVARGGQSPLLTKLLEAVSSEHGLVFRFSTYKTTLLFTQEAYRDAQFLGRNWATSEVTGAFGLWKENESATTPTGRILVQDESNNLCGNLSVEEVEGNIVVDLINAVREQDNTMEKSDMGDLQLILCDGQEGKTIDIGAAGYDREHYKKYGGLVTIPLADQSGPWLEAGKLELRTLSGTMLAGEEPYATFSDDFLYLNVGEERHLQIAVTAGRSPEYRYRWEIRHLDHDRQEAAEQPVVDVRPHSTTELVGDGTTLRIDVRAVRPGCGYVALLLYAEGSQRPSGRLQRMRWPFISVRVLPEDDYEGVPDSAITWDFVYDEVFRYYHVVYPGMSALMPLNNRATMERHHAELAARVDEQRFYQCSYMPVTRELSAGKRRLIQRWSRLLAQRKPGPP